MSDFLLKRYDVSVSGFSVHGYDAPTPGAARVKAWHSYCSYRHVTFKEFMQISVVRKGTPPEGYGRKILVSGREAFFVANSGHEVRFVLPGETAIYNSHPLDVAEVAA